MPDQPRKIDQRSMAGEVERLLRQLRPPAAERTSSPTIRPTTARPTAAGPQPHRRSRPLTRQAAVTLPSPLSVWARVGLGIVLAAGATQWPYPLCGFPLAGYFAAVAVVMVAGAWAGHGAWRRRMGRAHVLAIAIIFTGAALAALQVLPRLGYAPVETTWRCLG